jgi:threonine/homoserine/homoserine lactone efflux protein
MLYIVVLGLLTGFVVSMSFGTGFFSIIQTSISNGKAKAFLISIGLILSDIMFILLAVFATNFISNELLKYQFYIRLAGMLLLVILGIYLIRKSVKQINGIPLPVQNRPAYAYLAKGFLINSFNPLTLIMWIGTSVFVQTALGCSLRYLTVFFGAVLTSLTLSQYVVCHFAQKVGKWLSEKNIHRINIAAGSIMIAIGLLLFFTKDIETNTTASPVDKVQKLMKH